MNTPCVEFVLARLAARGHDLRAMIRSGHAGKRRTTALLREYQVWGWHLTRGQVAEAKKILRRT